MSVLQQLAAQWKAGGAELATVGVFQQQSAYLWSTDQISGAYARHAIGDGSGNSAVTAVLDTKSRAFNESMPTVHRRRDDGTWEPLPNHPVTRLLEHPNPLMPWDFLGDYTIWSTDLSGDAYWLRLNNGIGDTVQLWPLIPTRVTPKGSSSELITHYEYSVNGQQIDLPVELVVHLRTGLSKTNHMRGKAPLGTALLEVMTDHEASEFVAALLHNMGIPGIVVSPTEAPGPTRPQAEELADEFEDRFTGTGRGRPMVTFGGPVKIDTVSMSPKDLDIRSLRRLPEERIAAVCGVPPALAGLGAGLETGSALGGNVRETERQYMTDTMLIPLWSLFGRLLSAQLLTDQDRAAGLRVLFPLDDVRILQDDANARLDRLTAGVEAGWAMISEPRAEAGLPVDATHEVFLWHASKQPVDNTGQPRDTVTAIEPSDATGN